MGEADVADPHTGDQALVASRDQRAKLIDESRVWDGVFDEPQVHRGELVDAQRGEIFPDAAAQLVGVVPEHHVAGVVTAGADLAHQRQSFGVGEQRLSDQLVGHAGPVELCGVDVVDPGVDGRAQHR